MKRGLISLLIGLSIVFNIQPTLADTNSIVWGTQPNVNGFKLQAGIDSTTGHVWYRQSDTTTLYYTSSQLASYALIIYDNITNAEVKRITSGLMLSPGYALDTGYVGTPGKSYTEKMIFLAQFRTDAVSSTPVYTD